MISIRKLKWKNNKLIFCKNKKQLDGQIKSQMFAKFENKIQNLERMNKKQIFCCKKQESLQKVKLTLEKQKCCTT